MIKKLLKLFYPYYLEFSISSKPAFSTILFNVSSFFYERDETKLYYNKYDKEYSAITKDYKAYFTANLPYREYFNGGISAAGKRWAKGYFVNEIKFNPGDIFIDIGANVGNGLIYFSQIQSEIHYMGFEPSPNEFKSLQKNSKNFNGKTTLYNIALSNKNVEEMVFYVSSNWGDSSLIQPPTYSSKIKVKTNRLDKLSINKKIKFVKLEAEGAEIEILEGMKDILENIEYISANMADERGINQEYTAPDCINFLLKNNFELIKIENTMIGLFKNLKNL